MNYMVVPMEIIILAIAVFTQSIALIFIGVITYGISKNVNSQTPQKNTKEKPMEKAVYETKDEINQDVSVPLDQFEPDFSKPIKFIVKEN